MVTYLHIIDDILRVTGSCSHLFQATTTDMSVAVCKSALQSRRSDRKHFDTVVSTAKIFASEHDLNPEFSHQRRKIRRRYAASMEPLMHPVAHMKKSPTQQKMTCISICIYLRLILFWVIWQHAFVIPLCSWSGRWWLFLQAVCSIYAQMWKLLMLMIIIINNSRFLLDAEHWYISASCSRVVRYPVLQV